MIFDDKFDVQLNGDRFIINAINGASIFELLLFKQNFSERVFQLLQKTVEHENKSSLLADEEIEFASSIQLIISNDIKYEIGVDQQGRLVALRHGEPWRNCAGDNLLYALYHYALDLEESNASTTNLAHKLDVLLNGENAAAIPSLCDLVSQLTSLQGARDEAD